MPPTDEAEPLLAAEPDDAGSVGPPDARRQGRGRAVVQLIRLPNCFTAIPDALAGGFLAMWALSVEPTAAGAPATLAAAGLAAFLTYMGGVTMNDLVDRHHDRTHRPERPLPSGRVPVSWAWGLTVGPLVGAVALAGAFGLAPLMVAGVLIFLVTAYNVSHKRVPALGLPLMGLSRGANVLLGTAIAAGPATAELLSSDWRLWVLPALLTLWVLSISVVARLEGRARWAVRLVPRMILGIAVLDAVVLAALTGFVWPGAVLLVVVWIVPAAYLSRWISMS